MPLHAPPARVALRRFIDTQLATRQPPETYRTFQRLCQLGYTEDDAKQMLVAVLATEYYRYLYLGQPFDDRQYAQMLQHLPTMPWQAEGETEITKDVVTTEILENTDLNLMTDDETRDRYQQLRAVLTRVAHAMLDEVVKDNIMTSAAMLGLVQGNTIVLAEEQEQAVVLDHALYANSRKREQYLDAYQAAHPSLDDDSVLVIDAMSDACFRVMRCEARHPKLGWQVYDLLHETTFILVDQSLARTATPGILIAAHVVAPDGIYMTTGAPLPITDQATGKRLLEALKTIPQGADFEEQNQTGALTTHIIRALLAGGASEHFAYGGATPPAVSAKVGPNAPCPCGSGKKYKRCCGGR